MIMKCHVITLEANTWDAGRTAAQGPSACTVPREVLAISLTALSRGLQIQMIFLPAN